MKAALQRKPAQTRVVWACSRGLHDNWRIVTDTAQILAKRVFALTLAAWSGIVGAILAPISTATCYNTRHDMILRTKAAALVTISALALAACTNTTGEPLGENTRGGAIAGGLIGAAIGGIRNDDNPLLGAAIGGAIGAGVGGTIGSVLDAQERDLRESLDNDDILIQNTGSELIVTMPEGILFAIDSAVVQPSLRSDLGALARNLQQYPDTTVNVIGHTDNTGSAAYNQDLSGRRAQAVSSILLQNGVSPSRIRSFGRGEDQPVATNLTAEGRQQNRRVEVIITPTF